MHRLVGVQPLLLASLLNGGTALSNVDWTAVQHLYAQGIPLRDIVAQHGSSIATISRVARHEGWIRPVKVLETRNVKQVKRETQAQSHTNRTPKKDLSTKDRQHLFLEAFSEHANVLVSARAADISRRTVYEWLEHDEDFSFAYNQAKEDAKDVLRAEIYQRGKEGWDESVYEMGVLTKTVRKHSDTLLIFHAKMLMPEYREKTTLDVTTADPLAQALHALSDEQLAQFKQWVIDGRRHDGPS